MAKKLDEDQWAFVCIGEPFPEDPVRAPNQQNMYVALWYKHGKPTCGRAWNNGGVLECSFPYNKKELTGVRDLGGKIQVLQYKGDFDSKHFWYHWIPYKDRQGPNYELVRCGDIVPCYMKGSDGNMYSGELDMNTEKARCSYNGKADEVVGPLVQQILIPVRDKIRPPEDIPVSADSPEIWVDVRSGDEQRPFPVPALGRPLKVDNSGSVEHFVALWYKHGEPVMGRCWNVNGKYAAAFGWNGHEFTGNVGSFQVLAYKTPRQMGHYIEWRPYSQAKSEGWRPISVGDVAPCVIKSADGYERLGKVHVSKEKAGVAWAGKEEIFVGPVVQSFMVLCRKP